MSQRALTLPEFTPFPPPAPSTRPADAQVHPTPARMLEIEAMPESAAIDGSALKGFGAAVLFEIASAAGLYACWLLWKVLR